MVRHGRTDTQTDRQSVSQSVSQRSSWWGRRLIGPSGIKVGGQGYEGRASSPWTGTRFPVASRIGPSCPPALPRCAPSQSLVASCQGSGPLAPNPHPIPLRPPSTGALPGILAILARRQHRHPLKDNPPISHSHSRARPFPSSSSGLRTRFISDSIPPAPSTSSTACPISSTVLPSLVPTVNQTLLFSHLTRSLTIHHSPIQSQNPPSADRSPVPRDTLRRRISSPTRRV